MQLEVPSGETNKVLNNRMVELFGEESSSETPEPSSLGAVIVPAPRLSNVSSASNKEASSSPIGCPKSVKIHDKRRERVIQKILASNGIKSFSAPLSSSVTSKRKRKSVDSTSSTCPDSTDISPAQKKSRRSKRTLSNSQQPSTSSSSPSKRFVHSSRDEDSTVKVIQINEERPPLEVVPDSTSLELSVIIPVEPTINVLKVSHLYYTTGFIEDDTFCLLFLISGSLSTNTSFRDVWRH